MDDSDPRLLDAIALARSYDPTSGALSGSTLVTRTLDDLAGCFADELAYGQARVAGSPVVYTVSSVELGHGEGDLHYGIGTVMPGRVGAEYYLTKGHFHSWRDAAEVYVGMHGTGALILEDEDGRSRLVTLDAGSIVYVPGSTAHRTVNTGDTPLVYLGVYSARAGHDYDAIADRNFALVAVAGEAGPEARDRAEYTTALTAER